MKRSSEIADLAMPWAGLVIGLAALIIAHQFGSDGMFDHCLSVSPGPLLVISALAILATIGGAFLSWRVFNKDAEGQARKVIAAVSVGASALFLYAMILPMIASLVIPPCFQ